MNAEFTQKASGLKGIADPYRDVPYIDSADVLKTYIKNPYYVIEDYMESEEDYESFVISIFNIMQGCYDLEDCRHYPIAFKIYNKDKIVRTLPFNIFLLNVIFWIELIPLEIHNIHVIDDTYIKDTDEMTDIMKNTLFDYCNQLYRELQTYDIQIEVQNKTTSRLSYYLRMINCEFWDIINFNISLIDIFKLYIDYPEMKALMEIELPTDKQPYELEAFLDTVQKRLDKEIARIGMDNPIAAMASVKGYLKNKQLRELLSCIGTRPNLHNQTFPVAISNSYLIGGATKPSYMYIEADGLLISAFANASEMGNVGALTKKVALMCSSLQSSDTVFDCGSKVLVPYTIKTKNHLKKLYSKYYWNEDIDDYSVVKADSTDLIGKTIYVRSIATCALGDCCCAMCIGANATKFMTLDNFGIHSGQIAIMEVGQRVLSTKHLITTKSEKIVWSPAFNEFFTMVGSSVIFDIVIDDEDTNELNRLKSYRVIVDPDDYISDDFDLDDNDDYIINGRMQILNEETGELFDIHVESENNKDVNVTPMFGKLLQLTNFQPTLFDLYDMEDAIKRLDKPLDAPKRSSKKIVDDDEEDEEDLSDEPIMEVFVENFSLTETLALVKNIINRKNEEEYRKDINIFLQTLLDLYVKCGLSPHINDLEVLANRMMVSESTCVDAHRAYKAKGGVRRPKINGSYIEPYKIERMSSILEYNPSPNVRMMSVELDKQLHNLEFFTSSNSHPFDAIFSDTIDTSVLSDTTDAINYNKELDETIIKRK